MSNGGSWTGDRFVRLLAWCTVAVVGTVMLTQVLGWSPSRAVVIVQSLTPYLGLTLVSVALYSLWRSERAIAATSIATGVGLLVLATPLALPSDQPEANPDARGLAVASINLLYRNDRVDEVAELLGDLGPDVVVFSEYTAGHRTMLLRSDLAGDYPHRVDRSMSDGDGVAVWSRMPIVTGESPSGALDSLDIVVDAPDGPVRLLAIHVPSPVYDFDGWRTDLDIAARWAADASGAAMVVGDLNASYWHPPFRDLLDAGLTDAHAAVGAGFSASWPSGRVVPPFVRLDHALVTDELLATSVTDFDVPGSDHRGFVVTVVPAR